MYRYRELDIDSLSAYNIFFESLIIFHQSFYWTGEGVTYEHNYCHNHIYISIN